MSEFPPYVPFACFEGTPPPILTDEEKKSKQKRERKISIIGMVQSKLAFENRLFKRPLSVVICMEYIPQTVFKRLKKESENGQLTDQTLLKLNRELQTVVAFMKSQGFLHFDAHNHNILATDHHVYFADFGQAMSQTFELSFEEEAFFKKHIDYDRYYVLTHLIQDAVHVTEGIERGRELLKRYFSFEEVGSDFPQGVASFGGRMGLVDCELDGRFI